MESTGEVPCGEPEWASDCGEVARAGDVLGAAGDGQR